MTRHGGLGLDDSEHERRLLLQIIETISSGLQLGPLMAGVAAVITDATATDVCFIHLLDDDRRRLTLAGATPPFDRLAGRVSLAVGEGVSGWVAAHGEPVVIPDDKRADPRYRYLPELRGEDYTSMASVPMSSRPGTLVGVLNVHNRQRREFTDSEVALLRSIGRMTAGAIENARLHERLADRERAREQFAESVVAAQEGERRRLAREIHDGISQRIVSLAFHLSAAASALPVDPGFAAEQVRIALRVADATLDEARRTVAGLRPSVLDDLGLAASLKSLGRSVPGLAVEVTAADCELPGHVETALYRIAQEALHNAMKHAKAEHAWVELHRRDGQVRLRISDDGQGFAPGAGGDGGDGTAGSGVDSAARYGLAGMAERVELIDATLDISSLPATGTSVTVVLPVSD